jgi:hypothetical protein
MRSTTIAICCLLVIAGAAFAQSDRGTVTGSVSDQAGAVIPGATIEMKNINTGAVYQAQSSSTGNYTFAQLPAGTYQMSTSVPGFKQFLRTGITVLVAQTLRIGISLEVGAISETVTVNADAPLLRMDSGELAHNVASKTINELPILGFSGYIRDPFAVTALIPGALYSQAAGSLVRVNGAPSNTQAVRIEGQDATDGIWTSYTTFSQPSVDSVEEVAVQTSNFAAEYGQAGGGLFNMTMKSGTNRLHGSAYDYWYNEALNASSPYGSKDRQRRNDYGFTLGGPVYIPKVHDGRDKTFFFFNWEQFREKAVDSTTKYTVPTLKMRQGDFSEVLTAATVTTADGVTTIRQNQLYKPGTEHTYIGRDGKSYLMRDPYPGNVITDPLNSSALAIQKLIPEPAGPYKNDLTNNYLVPWQKYNFRTIPSVKIDHNFGVRSKLSGYWSTTHITANTMCDGFTAISPITACQLSFIRTTAVRLNYDFSLTPTKLLHLGAGLQRIYFTNDTPWQNFDQQKELGIAQPAGATAKLFPSIRGLSTTYGGVAPGVFGMGPPVQAPMTNYKPTANASLTWVKSNHTYKLGAELRIEGFLTNIINPAYGFFTFSSAQTGIPDSAYIKTLSVGFPYASFLLGLFDSGTIGAPAYSHVGKNAWAFFAQDSWKASRRLTLDYGLRWDYQAYLKETYGRFPNFSPTTPNPRVGNLPGAMIFERNGVEFANVYPYAFGPRLGVAYQITPKTVFRAGWGISYGQTATNNGMSQLVSGSTGFSAPSYGAAWRTLNQGAPEAASGRYVWPNLDPGQYNTSPTPYTTSPPAFDRNAGRPPRQMQWSIGFQRELSRNLMVEASYVGNRGAWWEGDELIAVNAISAERLASFGLSLDSSDDRALLAGTLTSAAAKSRINPVTKLPFSTPPYTGFPTGQTVAQSLRPFPQFGNIQYRWAPLGRTWYDSLQMKVTKRLSHGLDLSSSFTWQQELVMGSETTGTTSGSTGGIVNNVFDRSVNKYISTYSRPFVWITSVDYLLPKLPVNKALSIAIRDWRIGLVMNLSSGRPIQVPAASSTSVTSLYTFQSTFANRVAGQPLFLRTVKNADGTKTTRPLSDLNDRSAFDPLTDFVLNPAAWQDPPAGQYSTSTGFYNDYRYPRHPEAKLSIGRLFRLREGMSLSIRADFDNALNRFVLSDSLLTSTNAIATQTWNASGTTLSGFGRYNAASANSQRRGLIVARFQF